MFLQKSLTMGGDASPVNLVDICTATEDERSVQFDHNQFYNSLHPQTELGSTLLAASQLQSTQTLLQGNTAIIPNNTVCIAFKQVGGKGVTAFHQST